MMLSSIHRIQEEEWQLEGQVQGLQVRGPLSLSLISCVAAQAVGAHVHKSGHGATSIRREKLAGGG